VLRALARILLAGAVVAGVAGSPPLRAALVGIEPALAPLLVLAGLGAGLAGWTLRLRGGRRGWARWRRFERRLLRPAAVWQVAAALVFAAPLLAHLDLQPTGRIAAFAAQLGYLPWGDCAGHYGGANRLLTEGVFGAYSERRPMGASWLSVLLGATGERLPAALLLQAFILGACALLAARASAARFGLGAAWLLLGLTLGVARDYVPTASTEPLGLVAACLAVTLLASRAARERVAVAALGAFALALALNARPGAQLLLPALFVWGVAVAPRPRRWRAAAALVLAIGAAGALTATLNALHGAGEGGFTAYPAYTFYGLTRNANYRQVARDFPDEVERLPEKDLARFLYARALDNLRSDPRPFVAALFGNARKFLSKTPESLARAVSPRWLLQPARRRANPGGDEVESDTLAGGPLLLAGLVGFLLHLRLAGSRAEAGFWLLFFAGLLASATFVFGEAGLRSLTPVVPFLALGLSMAASAGRERPKGAVERAAASRRVRVAGAAALAVCVLCVLGPYAARALHRGPTPQQALAALAGAQGDVVVTDLRRAPIVIVLPFAGGDERRPEVDYDAMRFLLDVGDFPSAKALAQQRAPFAVISAYDLVRKEQRWLVATRALVREVEGPVTLQVEPIEGTPDVARVTGWTAW
jgi:hypothetical protein